MSLDKQIKLGKTVAVNETAVSAKNEHKQVPFFREFGLEIIGEKEGERTNYFRQNDW
jgi:hypothetical protein